MGLVAMACLLGLSACASTGATPSSSQASNPVGTAVQQPFQDLNLVRTDIPPVLQAADASPYERASLADCKVVTAQIAELDAQLGPDVDDKTAAGGQANSGIVSDLIQSAIGLPFRGIIRQVTGAEQRAQAWRHAVLAGMTRRAYLKGVSAERGCSQSKA